MPIVDIEFVCESEREFGTVSTQSIADALGRVFATPPGRTWVRLRFLDSNAYAENDVTVGALELPAFVTVLHARPPVGAARHAEVVAITAAVAMCLARSAERVHVRYAAAGAGRQAFGGRLVE